MKIVEKRWEYGTYIAFDEVPAELLKFTPGCRVVPAPYAGKPDAFYLVARYEPGENRYFPKGGFEVVTDGSMRRSFELDQVVVWTDGANSKKKATVRKKQDAAPKKVRVKVTKVSEDKAEAPAAKNAAAPAAKKHPHVCGATKKDGTSCQMRTAEGTRCRHHK